MERPASRPDVSWSAAARRDGGDHWQVVAAEVRPHRPRTAADSVVVVAEDRVWVLGLPRY